tara:strand:+ start:7867 stop:9144 length:1278 start_codon:yes stop_codon:yes gene_type:complete
MVTRITGTQSTDNATPQSDEKLILSARVRCCILDDKTFPKAFKSHGEWHSIGGIFWENVKHPNPSKVKTDGRFARPLFPNIINYPLENEIVYVIQLSSIGVETDTNKTDWYYFQPINIWNSIHHNAIPDGINKSTLPPSQQRDYQQTEVGSVKRVTNKGKGIDLGNTFKEKLDIKNLQPFEGDIMYEGRWGQSIRFTSTIKGGKIDNPWSKGFNIIERIRGEKKESQGDPLTIIRNGQHDDGKEKLIPQVEDINKDLSSIYITSTQSIPINLSSPKGNKGYNSCEEKPIKADKFDSEQIILNSGRLLFNSKKDSILLSSNKIINLNSVNSVTIDSKQTVINSPEILLGNKNATEPVILGDKFLSDLEKLLTQISLLGNYLGKTPILIAPATPSLGHAPMAVGMEEKAKEMIANIESYKSKISKSK